MTVSSDIDRLRTEFRSALSNASTSRDLQNLHDHYLGRKRGLLAALLKTIASVPVDQRRTLGTAANSLKKEIEAALLARREGFESKQTAVEEIDVTLPGRDSPLGHRHPLTLLREEIERIFSSLGFEILHGPEVEDDYHNFEALNMPADHPARDMQDTLYLQEPLTATNDTDKTPATLLRTHTSGMQIRYMETHEPPIRIIAPGLVYRRDTPDLTHSPMFQQVEGLLVGEDVTMADLKGTLECFLHQLFSPEINVMFRPSFFPYTEPSAEVFITCVFCEGAGCPVCKKTGWLEILGCGMVDPEVFNTSPPSILMKVDFPAPFGPNSPYIEPFFILILKLLRAFIFLSFFL